MKRFVSCMLFYVKSGQKHDKKKSEEKEKRPEKNDCNEYMLKQKNKKRRRRRFETFKCWACATVYNNTFCIRSKSVLWIQLLVPYECACVIKGNARDVVNERDREKGKEQCSWQPTRLLPIIEFLLSIVPTTCQQVVFVSIILFGFCISSPKLDHIASNWWYCIIWWRWAHKIFTPFKFYTHIHMIPFISYHWQAYVIQLSIDFVHFYDKLWNVFHEFYFTLSFRMFTKASILWSQIYTDSIVKLAKYNFVVALICQNLNTQKKINGRS